MVEPPNWFFSMCAFASFVLVIVPLSWHLEAWNSGPCMYMVWAGLACLNLFINSIVWNSDVTIRSPIWCDISAKLIVGSSVAIPACSLCIIRRLYEVVSMKVVTKTRAQKRRDVMVDLAICLGIPVVQMCVHYVVQNCRFAIFEGVGCYPCISDTPPAYALVLTWPICIDVVSAYYCIRTIRKLSIRRAQFEELLSVNNNLSSNWYFRLMGLATVEILCSVPMSSVIIYSYVTQGPIQQWESWSYSHRDVSTILQYPSVVWYDNQSLVIILQMRRYCVVSCALLFFGFFGFTQEAKRNYRLIYETVAKWIGLSTCNIGMTGSGGVNGSEPHVRHNNRSNTIPVYVTQHTELKHDSPPCLAVGILADDFGGPLAKVIKEPQLRRTSGGSGLNLSTAPVGPNNIQFPAFPEPTLDIDHASLQTPGTSQSRSSVGDG